jgi:signal transduction histidine kinase/DNA-binding response OmpR family regulator
MQKYERWVLVLVELRPPIRFGSRGHVMAADLGPRDTDRSVGELLDLAGEGLVLLDATGVVTTSNTAASQLLAAGAPLAGRALASLAPAEFSALVDSALAARQRTKSFSAVVADRDLAVTVKRLDHGVAIVVRDDSAAVQERERADAVLAAASDGLVLIASDGRVDCANPAACEMLSRSAKSLLGKKVSLHALVGDEHADQLESAVGESVELHLADGDAPVVATARLVAVDDASDRHLGTVLALHDITAEREIADMKNEFVSTVSHELRTPLTSIKGYVDLILDGDAGEINEIQREFLGIVKENSDRLVELINEMLDISRIESGRVHLRVEPMSVYDAVEGAVDTFRAVMSQTGRSVNVHLPAQLPPVASDRDRVGQVLINLVSNALKYSPGGGEVDVSAHHTGGFVTISVTDHGLGISAEDRKRLFTKFFRVDSQMTREIGGTGLGLSICKTIIELLGGEIGVKSRLGHGSTFWFTLPVAPLEMVRIPLLEGPDVAGGTILVVDRDAEVADLIDTYLTRRGFGVIKAHTADEALVAALRYKPRAITLDVILDEGDGFDLLHRLKENADTANIPVVVLSIVCDEGKSCRMGAANYLEKPIDQSRLIGMIQDIVGSVDSPVALVVDDDRDVVKLLSETLKRKGFAVIGAYDGTEAVEALKQRVPDIIVSDLKMPKMDGYELIQRVKTTPEWADVPVVVMTAHRIDPDRVRLLDLATHLLNKPITLEGIAREVEAVLVGRGLGASE